MKISASHTINLGLCKITLSRSGISVSTGIPGARVGMNTKGEANVRLGIPGVKGLSYTKKKKIFGSSK